MKRFPKLLGTFIIITGLITAALPVARWLIAVHNQRLALSIMEGKETTVKQYPLPVFEEPNDVTHDPDKLPGYNAILDIPKINLRAVVVHGVSEDDLKAAPGFYPQSKHPISGNVSIAAHRGVYGAWFRHINKLKAGDDIFLTLGDWQYKYKVRESFITHSRDWSVVESAGKTELTLTTCLFTTKTKRLIVKADLAETTKAPDNKKD